MDKNHVKILDMKMKLYEPMKLKFENPDWANNPEFGLIDTILDYYFIKPSRGNGDDLLERVLVEKRDNFIQMMITETDK
jgi:hypothetical protein